MINDIVVNILSGVAATVILEFLRSRFMGAPAAAGEVAPAAAPPRPNGATAPAPAPSAPVEIVTTPGSTGDLGRRIAGVIGRMTGALVFGFFFSAVSAGLMEAAGVLDAGGGAETIEFGTPPMIVLFTACTFVAWAGFAAASGVVSAIGKAFLGYLVAIVALLVLTNVEATKSIAAGDAAHESIVFAALALISVLLLRVIWPPKKRD